MQETPVGPPRIKVDVREAALQQQLATLNVPFTSLALPVGDVLIESSDGTQQVLLERKMLADLKSSIRDGRYRDQKARMQAWSSEESQEISRISGYIVEIQHHRQGPIRVNSIPLSSARLFGPLADSSIIGGIVNTSLRDGMPVFCVQDVTETAYLITDIQKRLDGGLRLRHQGTPKQQQQGPQTASIACKVHIVRKDNIRPQDCLVRQLCQIPLISEKKALAIVQGLGVASMAELIRLLDSPPGNSTQLDSARRTKEVLSKIPGIGDRICSAIHDNLFFNSTSMK
jgi:ERCC4-type nuclease